MLIFGIGSLFREMNHSTLRWGILSSAARGRAPFGSEMFFVRGVALEKTAGTYNKYRKAQLVAVVLEIKEP